MFWFTKPQRTVASNTVKKDQDGKPITYAYEYGSGLKVPNSRFVRQAVRALNKAQKRGKDPNKIIGTIANSESVNVGILKRDSWDKVSAIISLSKGTYKVGENGKEEKMEGEADIILWHPKSGYISLDGSIRQSSANGLLHELGHVFYENFDPEGKIAAFNKILNISNPVEQQMALDKYNKQEVEDVGDYDTYSDKWIIQNVESKFGEGQRKDHRGAILKTIGGIFSKKGFKFAMPDGEKGKVKDLKTK